MIAALSDAPSGDEEQEAAEAIVRSAAYLFAPVDKRAFGVAIGTVSAIALFAVTAIALAVSANTGALNLLAAYFAGYTVSWAGAGIGAAWGFATGFIAGWFVAFVRNLVLAASLFILRRRVELDDSRDFLDHI